MPKITITYEKPETLKVLKALGKCLDFKVSPVKKKAIETKGLTVIPGDSNVMPEDLSDIFIKGGRDAEA